MIAAVDFTTRLDGELVRLRAGLDRVHDRHPLVQGHPRNFVPDGSTVARELRAQPSMASAVRFTRQAQRALLDLIGEGDGREVGGALYGTIDSNGAIVIGDVGSQAIDVDRTCDSTQIPIAHCLALEDSLREIGSPLRWCGDFHTHKVGGGRPSEADMRAWRGLRAEFGKRRWLGVIATPGPDPDWPFHHPELHGWVTTSSETKAAILTT